MVFRASKKGSLWNRTCLDDQLSPKDFFFHEPWAFSLSLRLTFLFVTIVPKDISDDPPPSNDFFRHQHHRRNRGSPIYTTLLTTSFSGHRCALMHVFFPYAKQPRSDVHCQRVEPSFRQCFACRQPPPLEFGGNQTCSACTPFVV